MSGLIPITANSSFSGIVSQYAICHTCSKEWENCIGGAGGKSAYQHAKKTGHHVSVETTHIRHYNSEPAED